MISIVCAYNDEGVLKANLLSILKKQDVEYEFILIDNTKGIFLPLPKALNHGGSEAKGQYLMSVHQDVELIGSGWLKSAEGILSSIDDLGAAGVAGVDFSEVELASSLIEVSFGAHPLRSRSPS
jgi:hypothetical protein